jgi:hypothetical protein
MLTFWFRPETRIHAKAEESETKWSLIGVKSVSGYNPNEFGLASDPNRGMLAKRKAKPSDVWSTFALPKSEVNVLGLNLGDSIAVRCPDSKKTLFAGILDDYLSERMSGRLDRIVPSNLTQTYFIEEVEVLVKIN